MSRGALVVGYGNALRTDDGLGWHAADRLAGDPRLAGATVLQRHQLTPELAVDISQASFVVFVDASRDPAGSISIDAVGPTPNPTMPWSHHVDPSILLGLARDLYCRAPDGAVVRVGVSSVEAGENLSPLLEAVLPDVVDAVVRLVGERRGATGGGSEPARADSPDTARTTPSAGGRRA